MPILLLANKKRYRTNLDMLTNQEEDEDEYQNGLKDEFPQKLKLNLPR